jgi:hypothetical protein
MSSDALARPALVAACDWSAGEEKRWMAVAVRENGHYFLFPPEPVGPASALLDDLRERAGSGPILVGFDFPIGLPRAYAEKAGLRSFTEALSVFGSGEWVDFYNVAGTTEEINLHRPFYPPSGSVKGERSKAHLDKLTVTDHRTLLRRCERSTRRRAAASELFWTLGAKQVGRAAASGWREVLVPALGSITIWPFAGRSLPDLLQEQKTVVVEIYPAEAYAVANVRFGKGQGKATQPGRKANAANLRDWCATRPVRASGKLLAMIEDGFGRSSYGEDMFDAVAGLFGMIEVVNGRPAGAPDDDAVHAIEGWILGLQHESIL